jgi:hypothetical protein
MTKLALPIIVGLLSGCSGSTGTDQINETQSNHDNHKDKFEIVYDKSKISDFSIEKTEDLSIKAIENNLSEYSTAEIDSLPVNRKLSYSIIVATEISKVSLENTLKHLVAIKTTEDKDIDEIIIFVYDNKNDIGKSPYTFGKLLWAPSGELGNVTPEIASKNNRDNYEFDIVIKDKVGNISQRDMPTAKVG